jgi:hypothetical protein
MAQNLRHDDVESLFRLQIKEIFDPNCVKSH